MLGLVPNMVDTDTVEFQSAQRTVGYYGIVPERSPLDRHPAYTDALPLSRIEDKAILLKTRNQTKEG